MTPSEMGKKGGTNRWKKFTKKQRKEEMKKVRAATLAGKK